MHKSDVPKENLIPFQKVRCQLSILFANTHCA